MPIEIRELTIKVNVNNNQQATSSPSPGGGDADEKEEVVREAVEQVLRIIESKKER